MDRQFSLDRYRGQYVVLFFYPGDFTGVRTPEVHAFQERLADLSLGNPSSWMQHQRCGHPQTVPRHPQADGGAEGVTYPLIADTNRTVSDRFGTLNGQFDYDEYGRLTATSDLTCHRGTFILDKEGIILHQSYNFAPLGRDIDAVIRELDAIRRLQIDGQVCMPNWKG